MGLTPEACGRDQTPTDRARDYTCIRPRGHSGPCALVFVQDAAPPEPAPSEMVQRLRSWWTRLWDRLGGHA